MKRLGLFELHSCIEDREADMTAGEVYDLNTSAPERAIIDVLAAESAVAHVHVAGVSVPEVYGAWQKAFRDVDRKSAPLRAGQAVVVLGVCDDLFSMYGALRVLFEQADVMVSGHPICVDEAPLIASQRPVGLYATPAQLQVFIQMLKTADTVLETVKWVIVSDRLKRPLDMSVFPNAADVLVWSAPSESS